MNLIIAEEKKIKTRGNSQDKEFKKIEIDISPDLLNLEELKKLKEYWKNILIDFQLL